MTDAGPYTELPMPGSLEPIEIILKLPGEACNLNCVYCYQKRQPEKSDGFISPDLIAQLKGAVGDRPLSIGLHGGEPLLIGLGRMRELLQSLTQLNVVEIKLQTNGVLLDAAWLQVLRESPIPVVVGISHDGPEELSENRIDYRGSASRSASACGLQQLSRAGMHFGVICVVSKANVRSPERLIDFFAAHPGLSTVNFVPCFDHGVISRATAGRSGAIIRRQNPSGSGSPAWAIEPLEFLAFLQRAWSAWKDRPEFIIEPFVSVIRVLNGRRPESCDFTAEKCAHVFTIYPDGKITSCDEFESDLADLGGNLFASRARWPEPSGYGRLSAVARQHLGKCQSCSHQSTCGGGCIATRERYRGSRHYEEYCSYKKGLIDFISAQLERANALA